MTGGQLSHEELEELVTADVLDGLDPDERAFLLDELARHGPDCRECQRLALEYSEVAARLALTTDPVPLSPGAEERLLSAARGEATIGEAPAAPRGRPARIRRGGGPARWIAAAAVLVLAAGALGYLVAPNGPSRPASQTAFLRFASAPGTRIVAFPTPGAQHLAVAFHPGEISGWIVGTNVARPPAGHVYELWYRAGGANAPVAPAGTFSPTAGTVLTRATLATSFSALAVSVEPPGGSRQPTTTPIYLAPVTS
jgi:hypothetical protein